MRIFRIDVQVKMLPQGRIEVTMEHFEDLTSRFPETRNMFVAPDRITAELLLTRAKASHPEALWKRHDV